MYIYVYIHIYIYVYIYIHKLWTTLPPNCSTPFQQDFKGGEGVVREAGGGGGGGGRSQVWPGYLG